MSRVRDQLALSVLEEDGPVLGWVSYLPEAGRKLVELAESERVLLARLVEARSALRAHRTAAMNMALEGWTETEIAEAARAARGLA